MDTHSQAHQVRHPRDARYLALARTIARWSKDPGTKVGAVIMRPDRTIAGHGYNGFPRRVNDTPALYAKRRVKILRVVHAEANAILNSYGPLIGCTLYVSAYPPCATCAGLIIQTGIVRVHTPSVTVPTRWARSMREALRMFEEAGVAFTGHVRWELPRR